MNDVVIKTFEEFYTLLNVGWNRAAEYNSAYVAEHEAIHNMVKSQLHGLLGGRKDGPFNFEAFTAVEDGWSTSRVISTYFTTTSFLRNDLVYELQKIVTDFPVDYLLHMSAEDFEPHIGAFELIVAKDFTWALFFEDSGELTKIHKL